MVNHLDPALLQPLPLPCLVSLYPDHLHGDVRVLLAPCPQEILNHPPCFLSQRMLWSPLLQELRHLATEKCQKMLFAKPGAQVTMSVRLYVHFLNLSCSESLSEVFLFKSVINIFRANFIGHRGLKYLVSLLIIMLHLTCVCMW